MQMFDSSNAIDLDSYPHPSVLELGVGLYNPKTETR